ncbi:MAG: biotin carboxyl carrier domain-containing protein [Elusimicrobia bacterium]|nr:biotin carboxyl carrier domain-containing protein [Elusimicrobiota bacterium]
MKENNLEILEWNRENFQVKLVRQKPSFSLAPVFSAASTASPYLPEQPSRDTSPSAALMIRSPMMGIFYRAPSPSSPPYVKEEDVIKSGQVLCVIEAMKVFNEIKAEFDAKIVRVLVENGRPVKAGQELFAVERPLS